jgi:Asp/Glu/hydantoin racemase
MAKRVAFIHTVAGLAATFKTLSEEFIPSADCFHMVDESLLQNTIRANKLSRATMRRLAGMLASAQEAGAEVVMVTCSSLGPAVEAARALVDIPVLRVDQAMARQAVQMGARVGVAATLRTTLEPTTELVKAQARAAGKDVEVIPRLCEGAFEAVMTGDTATHDRIVSEGLRDLMDQCDVIVLAQASMARVVDGLSEDERRVPVLSSPRLGMADLADAMK